MRRILNNPGVRISLAIVVIVGLLLWYFYHATGQFIRAYETYATLSLIEENAAYAPGQPDNPVRREMNQTLAEHAPSRRRKRSKKVSASRRSARA